MKILRSVTRRGFNVGTAGYFTITSPARWFPTSRLPTGFQDFLDRPKRTEARIVASVTDPKTLNQTDSPGTAAPLQIVAPSARGQNPMRLVLIVLVAAALTLGALYSLAR